MAQEKKVSMPGVAEGKQLVGIPTDSGLSAEDKVTAFVSGAMAGEVYKVSVVSCCALVTISFAITKLFTTGLGILILPVWPSPSRLSLLLSPWPSRLRLHGRGTTLQPTGQPTWWMHCYPLRHLHDVYPGSNR